MNEDADLHWYIFDLRDAGGEVRAVLWQDGIEMAAPYHRPADGQSIYEIAAQIHRETGQDVIVSAGGAIR